MVCFYGFQCNSSAICESLKGFLLWFTDCLTIGIIHETVVVHMTWDWTFFNNYSNHPRMCVLSTLCGNVDKHSPFDIYIYIYIYILSTRSLVYFMYKLLFYCERVPLGSDSLILNCNWTFNAEQYNRNLPICEERDRFYNKRHCNFWCFFL